MTKVKTHMLRDGKVVEDKEISKEIKEKIEIFKLKSTLALDILGKIFGDNLAFAVAVIPEGAEAGNDIVYFDNSHCPGCTMEMILDAGHCLKIEHNDGRKLFEATKGESKH